MRASSQPLLLCASAHSCANPDVSLRPTRIPLEDTQSRATGYCSYCRRLGIGDDSARRDVFNTILLRPPSTPAPLQDFDADEYDAFDPDLLDEEEKALVTPTPYPAPVEPEERHDGHLKAVAEPIIEVPPSPAPPVQKKPAKVEKKRGRPKKTNQPSPPPARPVSEQKNDDFDTPLSLVDRLPVRAREVVMEYPPPLDSVPKIGFLKRTWIGLAEMGRGALDIGSSSWRMLSMLRCPLYALSTGLGAAALLIRLKPVRASIAMLSGSARIIAAMKYGLAPFVDRRFFVASSIVAMTAGLVLSPYLAAPTVVGLIASGVGGQLGWIIWRGMRGAMTGSRLFHLKKTWTKNWTDTKGMSTEQIAALNDQFESVVAELFSEIGFRAKVNGTQMAQANGHKGSGDGGVDVFIKDNSGALSVVSCKRYGSPVGVKEIRDIFAVSQSARFKGSRPMLVTTVGFTQPAVDFAKENGVVLLRLEQLVQKAGGLAT